MFLFQIICLYLHHNSNSLKPRKMKATEINYTNDQLQLANQIVETGVVENPISIYYITLGQSGNSKDVRFVLYKLSLKATQYVNPFTFHCILGDDLIEAAKKAKSICGTTTIVIDFNRQNAISAYTKWTPDVVRFGKNYGLKLSECPEKFVVWVAKGCPLYDELHGYWMNRYFGGEDFMKIAQEYAVKSNYGKMMIKNNNEYFLTNEQYEKAIAKQQLLDSLIYGHHEELGKRCTKKLEVVKKASYESDYGLVEIITFKDDENKVFVYKGTSFPQIVAACDVLTLTFGVKHNTYKDQLTTYIQRIKIAK